MLDPQGTYEKQMRVEMFECDRRNKMKLSWMMRRQQHAGEEQLQELGIGYCRLYGEGMVFLLSRVVVRVREYPQSGERLRIRTCPLPCRGAQFFRETAIQAEDGRELAHFHTSWMLVNPVDHRILRPAAFPYALPFGEADYDPAIFKFRAGAGAEIGKRPVYYSDLDVNGHVNNAVYADICQDFLPREVIEGRELSGFAIHYASEAALGTELGLFRDQPSADSYTLLGKLGDRPCFEAVLTLREQ